MNLSKRGSPAIMADNRAGVFLSVRSVCLLADGVGGAAAPLARGNCQGKNSHKTRGNFGVARTDIPSFLLKRVLLDI